MTVTISWWMLPFFCTLLLALWVAFDDRDFRWGFGFTCITWAFMAGARWLP